MRLVLARPSIVALVVAAAGPLAAGGCSPGAPASETETTSDAVVDIDHTSVKWQTIGNCWLYAAASWAESLAKSAGGGELDMSESYWTYWHWFEQIVSGRATTKIDTAGRYTTAVDLMARYGIMSEADFIAVEGARPWSLRQKSALTKINEALATGALSTGAARQDRALVRQQLDVAFELAPEVVAQLDRVFEPAVTRTLDQSGADLTGSSIKRPSEVKALLRDPTTKDPYLGTLADAIGTRTSTWGDRSGPFAWRTAFYPSDPAGRRAVLARMQRAMHDKQPVILSWHVDFAALEDGRFLAPPASPGSQGGHLVVVEDYQVNDVPGFGTLPAGVVETRGDALDAALLPAAKIEFIRIKNSWGTAAPDPLLIGRGYNDLYMAYLDGPMLHCTQNEGGASTDDCWPDTPLKYFVLPAGY
jgi:hypothetical protein